jgi:Zn-dependent protease
MIHRILVLDELETRSTTLLLFGDITVAAFVSIGLALLVGTTFHEFMHGYVAWLMGDSTPERMGRLTLNPMVHIYWPGFLIFLLVGFPFMPLGLAPVNPALMNYPRVELFSRLTRAQRSAVVSLGGPVGNFIIAVVFALPYRLLNAVIPNVLSASPVPQVIPSLGSVFFMIVFWNVLLGIFNLIPLGPLDGRNVLKLFLPDHLHYQYDAFQQQYGMFILIGLIMIGYFAPGLDILGRVISGPTFNLTRTLLGGFPLLL